MKKIIFFVFIFIISTINYSLAKDGILIKNRLFSIVLPEETKGFFEVKIKKNTILIFDKASKKAGFGGFVFAVKAYRNPSDHAVLPCSRKIGEIADKKGNLYDVVLKYPSDVQYDYTKNIQAPKSYKILYDLGERVDIKGTNGSIYYKNQGMKGEELYKDILKKHAAAIKEKWNSTRLEQEEMSYMYNLVQKTGYIYYDVNADGIDELLIGEIAQGNNKGVIYDIYTMVNRQVQHVISGGRRNRYYVCDDTFICNEYSNGANENGVRVYNLVENSTTLFPQVGFKYDGYENAKKPWFISYNFENDEWENVSKESYIERKRVFNKYERFDFIPLSQVKF